MMQENVWSTGTVWVATAITFVRGSAGDVLSAGVYHNTDPNTIPTVAEFEPATLVDGTEDPLPPLGTEGLVDVMCRIGARVEEDVLNLAPGDYQRWVLLTTADEDIILKVDTVSVR